MTENTFPLPDGRKLGYACYGPDNARPVLYFHGTPSSRLEVGLLHGYGLDPEQLLTEQGIQLIAVDRPGMGLSTYHPHSTLLSFAQDAADLLKGLQIHSCPVMCWSGGGPYALAIARQFPRIIPAMYILCGFTLQFTPAVVRKMHLNKWYFRSARLAPKLLHLAMNRVRKGNPRHSLPQWLTGLPDPDYAMLNTPGLLKNMSDHSLKEACRNGAQGVVHEARVYFEDFGFSLSEIQQPVHYWWGSQDKSVIASHKDAVAKYIPNGKLHLKDEEGHLSIYIRYFSEVIQAIASGYQNQPT